MRYNTSMFFQEVQCMPASYAHFRFGGEVFGELPQQVRKGAQRFRRLYTVGLQGPDLFFYYNPFRKNPMNDFGGHCHRQSGQEFFRRACKLLRREAGAGAEAYLYGLLTHYCLDSVCHPFVNEQAMLGVCGHSELEVEFDRFLLARDGHLKPHEEDLSPLLVLQEEEYDTASRLFPAVTARQVRRCTNNMAWASWILSGHSPLGRRALEVFLGLASKKAMQFLMTEGPNPTCARFDETMLTLYRQAGERFPTLARQLNGHIHRGTPLGEEFDPIFG